MCSLRFNIGAAEIRFDIGIAGIRVESAFPVNCSAVKNQTVHSIYRVALGIVTKCLPTVAFAIGIRALPILNAFTLALAIGQREKNTLKLFINATRVISFIDKFGLIEMSLPFRLLVDCVVVAGTAAYAFDNLRQGTKSIGKYVRNDPDSDFSDFMCGLVKLTVGCIDGMTAVSTIKGLYQGAQRFALLDKPQQESVIRYRSVGTLAGEKSCKAVVFDTQSHLTNLSWDATEKIYQNCDTLVYRSVSGPMAFCSALEDAADRFGQPIDVLSMHGHANPFQQDIGYQFTAQPHEMNCLDRHLAKDAQILSLGCNTGTQIFDTSLAKKLAMGLPGRTVKGIAAYLNPFFLSTRFNGKNFDLSHWSPLKFCHEGAFEFASWQSVVTFCRKIY